MLVLSSLAQQLHMLSSAKRRVMGTLGRSEFSVNIWQLLPHLVVAPYLLYPCYSRTVASSTGRVFGEKIRDDKFDTLYRGNNDDTHDPP